MMVTHREKVEAAHHQFRGLLQSVPDGREVMAEKERDYYLDTVSRLEPDIAMIDAGAGWASVAISLKRIADALQTTNTPLAMDAETRRLAVLLDDAKRPESWVRVDALTGDDFIAASRHLANVTNSPADHAAETVRVVFQAVRWAREGREPPRESTATMDHAGMPEEASHDPSSDPLDVAARAIMAIDPAGAEQFGALDMEQARAFAEAAIYAYEAIPDSRVAEMYDHLTTQELGCDADKWGEEFCRFAFKLGVTIDDSAWVSSWFANAIAAGARGSGGVICRCVLRLEKCTPDICRYGNAQGDSL